MSLGTPEKLSALVKEAARAGAKIVVLPETSITGYLSQDLKTNWHVKGMPIEKRFEGQDPKDFAEVVPGPVTKQFCALAKELDIYLTIPLLEVDFSKGQDKPRYFNTVCLANPKGELVAHYRKLTPWPYPEKSWATPGDRGVQTYDTEYGRSASASASTSTPFWRSTNRTSIWCLLTPSPGSTPNTRPSGCSTSCPERVKPFKHHLVGANWSVDKKQDWRGYGFSVIISNEGKVWPAPRASMVPRSFTPTYRPRSDGRAVSSGGRRRPIVNRRTSMKPVCRPVTSNRAHSSDRRLSGRSHSRPSTMAVKTRSGTLAGSPVCG